MSITKVFVKFGVMEPIVWPSTYCVKNWNKPPNKPLNKPLKLRFRLRPDAAESGKKKGAGNRLLSLGNEARLGEGLG
jgi:hypothetical protein